MVFKLLIHRGGKRYLWRGKDFHCKYGVIKEKKLEKNGHVKTHLGEEFLVCDPTVSDYVQLMKKGPQVIYPKDLGLIAGITGAGPGWRIFEAGTGSGSSCVFFANLVGEKGKIVSYEKNPEFLAVAKRNIEEAGFSKRVEIKNKDVLDGVVGKNYDLAILDMENAHLAVPIVKPCLKKGGFLVIYNARILDTEPSIKAVKDAGFVNVFTLESGLRKISLTKSIRVGNVHGFCGYLTFARNYG